jgi:murein hydrolase activator
MVKQPMAQTRADLEQDKQSIEREIQLINQMLQETKKTAEISLNHLVMINRQISSRENLIRTINNEISLINHRIGVLNTNIETLNKDLEDLRESYALMVQQAYRNRDAMHKIMFIFSSKSFNQAFLRMRYLQQYARHRQLQAEKIKETTITLSEQRAALQLEHTRQQRLLVQQRQEMESLANEKTTQDRTVTQLRKRERELIQRLREQELAARELQRAIERVIAEERRKAQELARAEGRTPADMFALTPEERLLSDNFADNQGRLLWPVERGVITSPFGEQPHPVLRGIKINNNGVEIAATEGARARAIFEGTVSRIIAVPGGNYAVIVRHGEYLTVYSNLSEVYVKNGEKVSLRQELGKIATEPNELKTHMNLQIWKGNDKLNPELWIARQR